MEADKQPKARDPTTTAVETTRRQSIDNAAAQNEASKALKTVSAPPGSNVAPTLARPDSGDTDSASNPEIVVKAENLASPASNQSVATYATVACPTESPGDTSKLHLIAGPGGSRAILATNGLIMALGYFGFTDYVTIGGISGGSLPLRLLAHGMNIREMIDTVIELKFNSLLDEEASIRSVMVDHYRSRKRIKGELPTRGQYKSDRLGVWLESFSKGAWPDKFWTLAVEENLQILLDKQGIFSRAEGEKFVQISKTTPPLGLSIQATCTVPGLFTPVELTIAETGRKLVLYDGGLSWEGKRPMTVVEEQYQAKPSQIILCDVGPESSAYEVIFGAIWKLVCGGRCISPLGKRSENENKAVLVLPVITSVASFDFDAHPDRKWEAIMEGFAATVFSLNKSYKLTETEFLAAKDIIAEFNGLVGACKKIPGELTSKTTNLLTDRKVL